MFAQGGVYTAKFFLTPPKTKIDSIIRDSPWISEFARLEFGQLGYPSCPRTSKFPKHPSFACARKFVRVQCRLYMVHCTNLCACESAARSTFRVSSYGVPYTPQVRSSAILSYHLCAVHHCCCMHLHSWCGLRYLLTKVAMTCASAF